MFIRFLMYVIAKQWRQKKRSLIASSERRGRMNLIGLNRLITKNYYNDGHLSLSVSLNVDRKM